MTWSEDTGMYACQITLPEKPCLVWYYFLISGKEGLIHYGNARDNLGGIGEEYAFEPPSWQITVYDAQYKTPSWMRESIMYQVFVDRFFASKPVSERPAPFGGTWHENWQEAPELRIINGDNAANDYFGGDLQGLIEKLPYIKSLGCDALYLNPVFEARSNHKYNTRDYEKIDPAYGTNADFSRLCKEAKKLGIRVVLDGVFSHTGNDSVYFESAVSDENSPYRSWYRFTKWPEEYESWWGFKTLPNIDKNDPSYRDFIIHGKNAVCAQWLRRGAGGWRLDVADELPMSFLRELRARIKKKDPEACVIGEVWEDASNKVAYGEQRCYCAGDTLDSCMNYPLRDAVLDFLLYKTDAEQFARRLKHIMEVYPVEFLVSQMNLLGSHDKARIINVLSGAGDMEPDREKRWDMPLTNEQYTLGKRRFLAAWRFLCALPGMPCMYYGDEAGATGMADPYCRGTYPWGREDGELLQSIRNINHLRHGDPRMRCAETEVYPVGKDALLCVKEKTLCCVMNRGENAIHVDGRGIFPMSTAFFEKNGNV